MIINPYKKIDKAEESDEKTEVIDNETIITTISKALIEKEMKLLETNEKGKVKNKIKEYIYLMYGAMSEEKTQELTTAVSDKIFGYGKLQKYIDDKNVTDIRAVMPERIYIKKRGKWERTNEKFSSNIEFEEYVRFCCIKNNASINFEKPVVVFSDRKNSLRIEAGIEPANVVSPSIVIRIHRKNEMDTLETLFVKYHMLDKESYFLLKSEIKKLKSFVLCGKGGSGKTTLLRAIINELPEEIAITTNEETAELHLENRNVIQRECILSREKEKNIDLEFLARQALVMSNDVIIIGELKGAEANTFFDSISTGHMGLATVHADSAENTIDRIITLIKKDPKAEHYTENFLRRLLSSSIDNIIYMEDFKLKNVINMKFDENGKNILWNNKYKSEVQVNAC